MEGRFFAPASDSRISIVDVGDIAAIGVVALTEAGKTYNITGPEALTHSEMATQLSTALGRQVTFVDIPETAMREALLGFGIPEWQADGLIEDYAHFSTAKASPQSAV